MHQIMSISFRVLLLSIVLSSPAAAQIQPGQFGFTVSGQQGSAGGACWGSSCTPAPLALKQGEVVQLFLRAPLGAPYLIALSLGPPSCTVFPSLQNELVLDPVTMVVLVAGTISTRDYQRFCYNGTELQYLFVPLTAPIGLQLVLQAVSVVTNNRGVAALTTSPSVLATIN